MRRAEGQCRSFNRVIRCACVLALFSTLLLGCKSTPPHPPTFSDFQRAFRKGWDAQVDVFAAAMLSDAEMERISRGTNIPAMLGAGLQGRLDDSIDLKLLEHATELSPTNALAWAALAYRTLSLLENHIGDTQVTGIEFNKAVDTLSALDPANSVPTYLKAAFECLETNTNAAKELALRAANEERFDTYEPGLRHCVIQALESVGSSAYTARIVASGTSPGTVAWSKLSKCVLAATPSGEDLRACVRLGARVERGGSFLNQLVGGSIQLKAMEKLGGTAFENEKKRIAEQKEHIKRATQYLQSARTRKITESEWVQYYDKCFEDGEMEAINWLAQKTGDSL